MCSTWLCGYSTYLCSKQHRPSLGCQVGRKAPSTTISNGKKLRHWHPSSTVPPPRIAENIESMSDVVPQQVLDEILLHEDESDAIRYSCDSPLFASNCEINTSQYYYKVFKIVVVACHKMKLHGEDSSRYHARYRTKWGGADTFYDGWLLLNGLKRESFQLDKFEKMFPNWLEHHKWYKKTSTYVGEV